MLTIGRLGRGQVQYYLDTVAGDDDGYYTRAGESKGRWHGRGAARLGLDGEVAPEDLRAVLDGRGPRTGEALGTQRSDRRCGFDLTFSAPKGVSLLALLGPPDVQREVLAAHRAAVAQTLDDLEARAAWVRRGRDGSDHERADRLVEAGFVHHSSRAGDPQLHTHVLVANLAATDDGRWSAPDARAFYAYAKTGGFLYQAALRAELTDRLGLEWGPVTAGMAEPAAFSAAQLRAFSRRREQIEATLAEVGAHSGRAAQVAALHTRRPKDTGATLETMRAAWQLRAQEAGIDVGEITRDLTPGRRSPLDLDALRTELCAPGGLTHHDSTFDTYAVLRAVAERAGPGASPAEVDNATGAVLGGPEVVRLGEGRWDAGRFTTRELLALEAQVLGAASRDSSTGAVSLSIVEETLAERPNLAAEQQDMVRRLVAPGRAVEVVVGVAGAGKTFALEAANAAWQTAGVPAIGAALAARAAAGLEQATGIRSVTVARVLTDLDRDGHAFARRGVVVVDEAGMVGTRDLARLVAAAGQADARVVLVGDHRQLPEIEAGGILGALAERGAVATLSENRRAAAPWERRALAELRAGDPARGVAAYEEAGRVVIADTAAEARTLMVRDWAQARAGGVSAAMYALRRAEIARLNALARATLRAGGELGVEELDVGGRAFATGDEVLALHNDARLGLLNGTTGRVIAVDAAARTVDIETHDARRLVVPAAYLEEGHLTHAYAMTVHKSQGATVDVAFVFAPSLYRELGYAALSRVRDGAWLYVVAGDDMGIGESHVPPPDRPDPIAALTRDLSRSSAQRLASDQLDDAARWASALEPAAERYRAERDAPARVEGRDGTESEREHDLVALAERADAETARARERAELGRSRDDGLDLGMGR
ncbi:MAG: relaxase domain-containing protein [Acidimicrobiia bacterium]|nr:relaxase domain-containing protein [Acidimicrobiia bacterium]